MKNSDHYKSNPEEYAEDIRREAEDEVRTARRKAKKRKRYVYTEDEARNITNY